MASVPRSDSPPMPIRAEIAMFTAVHSPFLAALAASVFVFAGASSAAASWITIKNDTKHSVVVQETMTVNGQVKRCKPVNLLPGETHREFIAGPTVKKLDVFDAQNPNRSLWSGSLHCKDESQTFSIVGSGETVTVRPVVNSPNAPHGPQVSTSCPSLFRSSIHSTGYSRGFPPCSPLRADDTHFHTQRPTRVRYTVLAFFCTLSMITYIDRAFWEQRGGHQTRLGLKSVAELVIAIWAFQLAYALFEVPTGCLGDRFGPQDAHPHCPLVVVLLCQQPWWATVWNRGDGRHHRPGCCVFRFLFGVGEAGLIRTWPVEFTTGSRSRNAARREQSGCRPASWGLTPLI